MRFASRFTSQMGSPISAAQTAAREYKGNLPLLDASQGVPSYEPPSAIVERLALAVSEPEMSRYTHRPGIESLRGAICRNVRDVYGADIEPGNTIVTAGCNQAFCLAVSALCDPGDEVILVDPFYFNHEMWLRLEGIRTRYWDISPSYTLNVPQLISLVSPRTKALVIVSPSNPTGQVVSSEKFSEIYEFCKQHSIVLIVDETYRMFRSGQNSPHSLYSNADVLEHCIFLLSFSKEYGIPGYRVGAIVSNIDCIDQVMKMFDCITICAPRIGQEAALVGLEQCSEWIKSAAGVVREKSELFREVMSTAREPFRLVNSGSYFGWVKVEGFCGDESELIEKLVNHCGLLVLPGSIFTRSEGQFLRFSIASLDEAEIRQLPERLELLNLRSL